MMETFLTPASWLQACSQDLLLQAPLPPESPEAAPHPALGRRIGGSWTSLLLDCVHRRKGVWMCGAGGGVRCSLSHWNFLRAHQAYLPTCLLSHQDTTTAQVFLAGFTPQQVV